MQWLLGRVRNVRIVWAAVLLFAALLAQSPHAGLVFLRNADGERGLEYWLACLGAIVYACALEGATAYFVWQRKTKLAAAFAVFSILHNVAYYLPAAWAFSVWGADLAVRNVMGQVLISLSLPIAIAAFSHTAHAGRSETQNGAAQTGAHDAGKSAGAGVPEQTQTAQDAEPAVDAYTQTQEDAQDAGTQDAAQRMTKAQRRLHIAESGIEDPAQVAAQYGVKLRTAQDDIKAVRSGVLATNGKVHA